MPRLRRNRSFLGFVLVTAFFFAGVAVSFALMLWHALAPAEQELVLGLMGRHASYLFGAGVLLLAGLGFALDWVFRLYVLPLDRITEETALIYRSNPSHRLALEGSPDVMRLSAVINQAAERFEELNRSVAERIAESNFRLEQEKSIFSTVLAELPEGIVICSPEGRITLYNERARELLENTGADRGRSVLSPGGGWIGLGRSIFGLVAKPLLAHALDDVDERLRSGRADVVSSFAMLGANDRILQAAMVPILSPRRELSAFGLILSDVSGPTAAFQRAEEMFHTYARVMRSALAGIRSAVELILDYPHLSADKQDQLYRLIQRETLNAGEATDRLTQAYAATVRPPTFRRSIRAADFIDAVRKRLGDHPGLALEPAGVDESGWVRVDPYALAVGVEFILMRVEAEIGVEAFRCGLAVRDRAAELTLAWSGPPLRLETLRRWEKEPVVIAGEPLQWTLKEILDQHKAEIWPHAGGDGDSCLRLRLEAAEPMAVMIPRRQTILATARPVYYDFDLFGQPGQSPELDHRPLAELAFTVFDTETTGLNPREGDEIVALGAVRIVNGRLLETECFDQLVRPQGRLRAESIRVHGIQPEMLADQPGAGQVLGQFQRFAEGTILVAHNAAFDMRLLQIQGEPDGIRFDNPVLDTMLISTVVHPAQSSHDLEAIAERLGVVVMGRHTALGDAMAAAEIFLKLLPLLAAMGISTLGEARRASQNSYYARLKY
ncbi:MAG: exonuclease domain-containing protein [Desulfobacterales bacterium]|nr:exonuclease domain-containing protein [Desulfobacterales bacterium]